MPFKIKKASLPLRTKSRLEKIFSIGINCMSLAVWLGAERQCSATGGFRYVVRVIYGAAVFMKSVLRTDGVHLG